MSTAEIESALILHPLVAEAAVVGVHDDLTGQAVVCFVTLKQADSAIPDTTKALTQQVRHHIGPFATPKRIILVPDLPKTRSGKIMRRILRKIAAGDVKLADARDPVVILERLGDISTLADSGIVAVLIECFANHGSSRL